MELKDKTVIVAGVGKSGIAAANTLINRQAQVFLYDKKEESEISEEVRNMISDWNIECFWGKIPEKSRKFDYMVISPGIPLDEDIAVFGRENCGEMLGELELAYRLSKGNYIGITGTNGKTTTTSLVGEILERGGRETFVVGNIGSPVVEAAEKSTDDSWFAAELSSFQLETVKYFKAKVSAVLNVTPDHLNRHKTMEAYAGAKARVFENQTKDDYFVVNMDCEASWKLAGKCPAKVVPFSRKEILDFGCYVRNENIVIKDESGEEKIVCGCGELQIPGAHNLENALAAAAMCYFSGVEIPVIAEGLRAFEGVEHRIEFVSEIEGVKYYNDSKGTNTDASTKAIEALKRNIILIAGGYDKKEDFGPFVKNFDGRVKHMYLIGVTAPIIAEACDKAGFKNYTFKENMEQCVQSAYDMAEEGDTVLLSPACASWGMYNNYEERGRHFKECVKALGGK
ncbi:MAG: UDP-N-acetylmuramoyl-L-alanine--D-glutamate ligase [Bacillota bacterium]|nr:UDP-N-acetylmuramoyl-L-alanine--D-glutamate ligase [Bacillota bacterium]